MPPPTLKSGANLFHKKWPDPSYYILLIRENIHFKFPGHFSEVQYNRAKVGNFDKLLGTWKGRVRNLCFRFTLRTLVALFWFPFSFTLATCFCFCCCCHPSRWSRTSRWSSRCRTELRLSISDPRVKSHPWSRLLDGGSFLPASGGVTEGKFDCHLGSL